MLEDEIFCLLGHNGAGKTTTVGMLTGLVELSSGNVSIYGHDLEGELQAIRKLTGICPQHNVLIPSLTVKEHLNLFGQIKGLFGRGLTEAVEKIIGEIGLVEKTHINASSLSGGMQRKLSLAIALLGDPLFCLLDEPTSGMDPYSRRSTWELLMKKKKGMCPVSPMVAISLSCCYHDNDDRRGNTTASLCSFYSYTYSPPSPSFTMIITMVLSHCRSNHHPHHSLYGRSRHSGGPNRYSKRRTIEMQWEVIVPKEQVRSRVRPYDG
jgi:ABC-type lipoprotein export system ATPase subunit